MLTEQHHYLFLCNGNIKIGTSAPTLEIAKARLAGRYDPIEYLGENPRLEVYGFVPRVKDWLSKLIERPTKTVTPSSKKRSAPTTPKLTRTQELMAEKGIDEATASLLAQMEKSNKA